MIWMSVAVSTVSKGGGELGVVVADEEPESLSGVLEVHDQVARLLGERVVDDGACVLPAKPRHGVLVAQPVIILATSARGSSLVHSSSAMASRTSSGVACNSTAAQPSMTVRTCSGKVTVRLTAWLDIAMGHGSPVAGTRKLVAAIRAIRSVLLVTVTVTVIVVVGRIDDFRDSRDV
jgi:hypothetical protein